MVVSPNKFDPKEIENSKRIFKSATPKYTVDWYIKWVASFLVLGAMSVRGLSGFELWDLILSIAGVSGWLIVAVLWKDRALILVNAVGAMFLLRNLVIALSA